MGSTTLIIHLVPVNTENCFRIRVAELEGEDRHFEKFLFWGLFHSFTRSIRVATYDTLISIRLFAIIATYETLGETVVFFGIIGEEAKPELVWPTHGTRIYAHGYRHIFHVHI